METKGNKKRLFATKDLVSMALFTAVLSVSAYISIPLPLPGGVHLSILNLVILLIALLFPVWQSFFIVLVWLLLGIVGIPVFAAGSAGVGYFLSPLGGYNLGFLLVSILLPLLKQKKQSRIFDTILAVIGVLIIDIIGMVWMKLAGAMTWQTAFLAGFLSVIPLDIVKAVVVARILPVFRRSIVEV